MASGSWQLSSDDGSTATCKNIIDSWNPTCDPCKAESKDHPAEGFCVDCGEYLCTDCYNFHKKLRTLKHHVLQDKTNMPRDKADIKVKDICTDKCPSHADKVIEYFCQSCDQLGCSACIISGHRRCLKVDSIPDIVNDIEHSKDFTGITEVIRRDSILLSGHKNKHQVNVNENEKLRDIAKEIIKVSSREAHELVEKLKNKMDRTVEQAYHENLETLSPLSSKICSLTNDLQKITSNIKAKKSAGLKCQLFVALKKAKQDIVVIQRRLDELENQNRLQNNIEPTNHFQHLTLLQEELGRLLKQSSQIKKKLKFLFHLPLQNNNDKYDSNPAGMCMMSENCLLVVDYGNNSVKVIDINKKTFASVLTFKSYPWDVTRVSDRQVAVTFPNDGEVKFLALSSDYLLSEQRTIDIGKGCRGIRYSNEQLFVSYCGTHSGSIRILSMSGKLFKDITRNKQQFQSPLFLDLSPDKQSVYVSDAGTGEVTCMTVDGEVKALYKCEHESAGGGISVDVHGCVYLCGVCNFEIQQLSEYCNLIQTLPIKKEAYINTVSCEKTNRLFVGSCSSMDRCQISVFDTV